MDVRREINARLGCSWLCLLPFSPPQTATSSQSKSLRSSCFYGKATDTWINGACPKSLPQLVLLWRTFSLFMTLLSTTDTVPRRMDQPPPFMVTDESKDYGASKFNSYCLLCKEERPAASRCLASMTGSPTFRLTAS